MERHEGREAGRDKVGGRRGGFGRFTRSVF